MCAGGQTFPERDQIEEELTALLRQGGLRNHRAKKDVLALLEGEQAPKPNKNRTIMWPEFRGPSSVNTRNLGKISVSSFDAGKYSDKGHVTGNDMIARGIPTQYANTFARAFNGSKARNTWKQQEQIKRTIERCEYDSGIRMAFPWGTTELQTFVGWCLEEHFKGSTITQYVSNVRSLHRDQHLTMDNSDWPFLSQVIKGHDNTSAPIPGRVPMTPELLLEFKKKLSKSRLSIPDRRLVWVVATALFQGSFRVGELLAPSKTKYCPQSTLRSRDVKLTTCKIEGKNVDMLMISLRRPKEVKGSKHEVKVEVFDLGEECFYSCPVAWKKWRASSKLELEEELPVFRWEDGSFITAGELNKLLKDFLADKVPYEEGIVATHSFRAGIVSVMGVLGYTDEEIMRQGRWRSSSFLEYVKLGRAARLQEQWKLANKISTLITGSMATGEIRR